MRWLNGVFLSIFFFPLAYCEEWSTQNEQEALFVRRIADFWQEGEYQIVKNQIEEFLKEYPNSSFSQMLHETLGDLYVREKNMKGALLQYSRITDPQIIDRVFLNRMQCLFELQWYATLADECEAYLQKENLNAEAKLQATYFLAIALYQQCLNTQDDSTELSRLALRAQPYFQFLLKSDLSQDAAHAFVHLCCILKDFVSASQIYLHLAEQDHEHREEMLFQAALLQAEFDKTLAMKTFHEVASLQGNRAHDALYNQLVLSYDAGKYEEVLSHKDELMAQIPLEQQSSARLFFGRSYLQMKQYPEALQELLIYANQAPTKDLLRVALIDILDIAYQLSDDVRFQHAFKRLSEEFPDDEQIPKAIFAHVLLLQKNNRWEEALSEIETLCSRFPRSPEVENARFEQIHMDYQEKRWERCRQECQNYLQLYPNSEFNSHVWRYLASVDLVRANEHPEDLSLKEDLVMDLESLLKQKNRMSPDEQNDWCVHLAKINYELHRYAAAVQLLEPLLSSPSGFSERANATLLLALCYRDGLQNNELFCQWAEKALALHADLLDEASQHIALFNGYLALNQSLDPAADHLYQASQKLTLEPENLRWLSDYYFDKEDPADLEKSLHVLHQLIANAKIDIHALNETTLPYEGAIVRLATIHGRLGQTTQQIELLENLKSQQDANPNWDWKEDGMVNLQLANYYATLNQTDRALTLFDQIILKNPTIRSYCSASAALQSAQLRLKRPDLTPDHPETQKILSQLKTLVLQKNLLNEPIHLEAALEYVDFQTRLERPDLATEKRLNLLNKIKSDFERSDDLLSRDYQNSRKVLPEKDQILQSYLSLINAEILLCQYQLAQEQNDRNQLLDRAKKDFDQILSKSMTPFIANKVREKREQMDRY